MTHTSSYRYGSCLSAAEPHSAGRSSEVRVSYFDPVTGEPCATKPKPLDKQVQPKRSAYERFTQQKAAEAEAAEIMRNMKKRRVDAVKERKREHGKDKTRERKQPSPEPPAPKRKSGAGRPGKPVLVDGVLLPSVTAAAKHIGTSDAYLCRQLLAGASKVKGRQIAFAEVVE